MALALIAVGVAVVLVVGAVYCFVRFVGQNNSNPMIDLSKYQDQAGGLQYAFLNGSCGGRAGAVKETPTAKLLIVDSKCVQVGKNRSGYPVDKCESIAMVIGGVCQQDAEVIEDGIRYEGPPCRNHIEKCFKGPDCGGIENADIKNFCFAYVGNDYLYCDIVNSHYIRENCYSHVFGQVEPLDLPLCKAAIERHFDSACLNKFIDSATSKEECEEIKRIGIFVEDDVCYYNAAGASDDPRLCAMIDLTAESTKSVLARLTTKANCYFQFDELKTEDSKSFNDVFCDKLSANDTTKDDCHKTITARRDWKPQRPQPVSTPFFFPLLEK